MHGVRVPINSGAKFAAIRTGSAAHTRATPVFFPPHRRSCRIWYTLDWHTFSSRPSLLTSMAMAAAVRYLSLFFKHHRAEYYRLLREIRRSGDWEARMAFFSGRHCDDRGRGRRRNPRRFRAHHRGSLASNRRAGRVRHGGPVNRATANPPCHHHSERRQITQDDEATRR